MTQPKQTDIAIDTAEAQDPRRPPLTKGIEQDLRLGLQVIRDNLDYLKTCDYPGPLGERFATKAKSLQRVQAFPVLSGWCMQAWGIQCQNGWLPLAFAGAVIHACLLGSPILGSCVLDAICIAKLGLVCGPLN